MSEAERLELQRLVKEAVAEALKGENLIDGPTHILHHQWIADYCDTFSKVKIAGLTAFALTCIGGVITLIVLGFRTWMATGKGG